MQQKPRKKVGLVLGSGGVRGLAHIGVIKIKQGILSTERMPCLGSCF